MSYSADYYVSSSGSDSNVGTEAAPFLTIQKGIKAAMPGDVVIVKSGSYSEVVKTTRSGTSENFITIRGEPGASLNMLQIAHAYIIVDRMNIYGGVSCHLTAANCIIQNNVFNLTSNDNKSNVSMSHGDWGNRPVNITIRHNRLLNAKGTGVGVGLQGRGHIVENNYFSSQLGADAIMLHSSNTMIRGNTFENWSRPSGNTTLHTDLFQAFGHNGEISKDNIIERNFAINCSNTQIGNLQDNKRNGNISNWTWSNNIFVNVDGGMSVYTPGMKWYNNTFYKSGTNTAGPLLFRSSSDRGSANYCKLFNNIFYQCGSDATHTGRGWYHFVLDNGPLLEFEGDYNLVVGKDKGIAKGSGWTADGREKNGINGVSPQLLNLISPSKAGDFRPLSTSPIIGAARILSESPPAKDFNGTVRGEAWDIGAYESDSAPDKVQDLRIVR